MQEEHGLRISYSLTLNIAIQFSWNALPFYVLICGHEYCDDPRSERNGVTLYESDVARELPNRTSDITHEIQTTE